MTQKHHHFYFTQLRQRQAREGRLLRILYAAAAAVLAAAMLFAFFPGEEDAALYDSVLRLHVLADSDSESDQAAKLAVRDALLEVTRPILEGCASRDEAEARLAGKLSLLEQTAREVLAEQGKDYGATALLGVERYPTRTYASAALPAGEYLSLRVVLGEGDGKNWWCVLFPPLCLSAATEQDEEVEEICIAAGLTPEQYRLITDSEGRRYTVRFKLLELLSSLFGGRSADGN